LSWINKILLEGAPSQIAHDNIKKIQKVVNLDPKWPPKKINFQIIEGRETKFSSEVYDQE